MNEDLETLLTLIKERDLLVKVDTNGSFPARLESLIRQNLVDHIAMDVKAPLDKYPSVTRTKVRAEDIRRSISLIRSSGLSHIFRTTVVPGLVEDEEILQIARLLEGVRVFQIQQFKPGNTLDRKLSDLQPFALEKIQGFAETARPYFSEVRVEGV